VDLEGAVGDDSQAEDVDDVYRQGSAKSGLHIEFSPSFTSGKCRRNDGARRTVLVGSGGDAAREESGENRVAVLLIAEEESVFQGDGKVAGAVRRFWVFVEHVRRQVEE